MRNDEEIKDVDKVQGSQPINVNEVTTRVNLGEQLYNIFRKEEDRVKPVELQRIEEGGSMLGNQLKGSVLLPMPKVVDTNGCEWGESELNVFGFPVTIAEVIASIALLSSCSISNPCTLSILLLPVILPPS